jgi:hypothetical protein
MFPQMSFDNLQHLVLSDALLLHECSKLLSVRVEHRHGLVVQIALVMSTA